GEIDVYAHRADPEPVMTLPATTILGTTTVLLVVDAPADGWARVLLPVRPNGSTGWISLKDVELSTVPGRIVIELGTRTLTYYENDEARVATRVGVGTERNPTPTGTFYVTDSVTLSDANSPWGPAALGLSARSETITEYNGGDGIIGIHGTNKPSSIGGAVSLGCIRLANDVIVQLHELVPLGTPVEIVP
ncbi:MAG: L,D-transpeptidase, partial [Acidimicrobiia bacterium]